MHVMGRIGFIGLGIALVGALSGAPVFAADSSSRRSAASDVGRAPYALACRWPLSAPL